MALGEFNQILKPGGGESPRGRHTRFLLLILAIVAAAAVSALLLERRPAARRAAAAPALDRPTGSGAAQPVPASPVPVPLPAPAPRGPPAAGPAARAADAGPAWRARLAEARALLEREQWADARALARAALDAAPDPALAAEAETVLGAVHLALACSPAPMPEKTDYLVQPGDSLERIARRFHTTADLLRKGNRIERAMLHPGDRLRVFTAPFSIQISKSRNDLLLLANDRFFKRYRVGTGKFGTTPTGVFVIADKIEQPPWWRPDGRMVPFGDKENVLGTRWMALQAAEGTAPVRGYGIHGTWEPDTIGRQESAGCIRLLNADVEELFVLVPRGVRVTIGD